MMEKYFLKVVSAIANVLLVVLLMPGCTTPAGVATPLPIPSRTPDYNSMPTDTLIPSPEPSAKPRAAVTTRTPLPINPLLPGAISSENATQILQLAQWGKGAPLGLQYSPDGKLFALLTSLGVYLYEIGTLNQVRFLPARSAHYAVAFSPDWATLAWGEGTQIQLLRLSDGVERLKFDIDQGTITGLNFSPGANRLAVKVHPPGEEVYTDLLELRSATDGSLEKTWDLQGMNWAFSPDWKLLVSWSGQTELHLWQLPGGEPLPFAGEVQMPALAAFSPDGTVLATTSQAEPGIGLWPMPAGTELRRLEPGSAITGLAFLPDGASLAASDETGAVHLWRMADGSPLQTYPSTSGWRKVLSFSPDTATLALGSAQGIDFTNVADGSTTTGLDDHVDPVQQMAFAAPSQVLSALSGEDTERDRVLRLWQMSNPSPYFTAAGTPALSLAAAPAGDRLALGMWDGRIQILEASTGNLIQTFAGHPAQVQNLAFSPAGNLLASTSIEEIRLWQVVDGSLQQTIPVPGGWVNRVVFSPDGAHLASLSNDGAVRVWQTKDGSLLNSLAGAPAGWDGELAFSPDGAGLALAAGPSVLVWKASDGEALPGQTVQVAEPGTAAISLAFAPGGDLLAVGLSNGRIELWSLGEKDPLKTLEGHTAAVTGLAFSSDGLFLASSSLDGTIRLWGVTGAR